MFVDRSFCAAHCHDNGMCWRHSNGSHSCVCYELLPANKNCGLSPEPKSETLGFIIGLVAALVLLALIIFFFWLDRKKSSPAASGIEAPEEPRAPREETTPSAAEASAPPEE
ncbi:unnamed protein product [Cylicocyclus nassatus]|uniref:Uncharacterized protein n=1 Tax=Cylicocyclus nassatus TaxID=53992 RepID=A0AA36HEH0_CYLNA|nr:unnamed protein product [Cylicocyclus nassatus]